MQLFKKLKASECHEPGERQERRKTRSRPVGIVKLTHHKLRQPQDMCSEISSEYSIWGLGPSTIS